MAAPLPAKEGDRDARASPARSSLRGLAEPARASSAPMAQVTPEVPLPAAATIAVGAQQAPPQDVVAALPLLLLLHRLLSLRLLLPFWIVLLLSWTGCGRIFLAPTLAWWPGAWSWLQDGFAPMLRFGRRWSRPQRLAMRRGMPSLRQRLLVTQPWGRWSTSVVAARRWRTSCKACGTSSRKRPAFAKSRNKV